jgi:hypothetical protein
VLFKQQSKVTPSPTIGVILFEFIKISNGLAFQVIYKLPGDGKKNPGKELQYFGAQFHGLVMEIRVIFAGITGIIRVFNVFAFLIGLHL